MKDSFEQTISCDSKLALEAYDAAVDCQLHAWPGALAALDSALSTAPDFALAHSTRALILLSSGRGPEAREASSQAQRFGDSVTEREKSHIGIVQLLLEGRAAHGLQAVRAHAKSWPRDALVISTALGAFGLIAFSGIADHDRVRFDFVQELTPHYPKEDPWMLSHRGWVLIETARPEEGLPFVARSLSLRPANGNAAHVMMHARFELNEPEVALRFADEWLMSYPAHAMLFGHIHWHAALCELDLDNIEQALSRLTTVIEPHLAYAPPLVGLTDTTALLWRLRLQGRAGLSWLEAQRFAAAKFPQGGNVFAELHLAMLAAGLHSAKELQACGARVRKQSDAGHAGAVVVERWVDALTALLGQDSLTARAALQACTAEAVRIGGSHAQRTIINRTLAWLN